MGMRYRVLLFALFPACAGVSFAQTTDISAGAEPVDSVADRYIESMDRYLSLKLSATDQVESFAVSSSGTEILLEPNTVMRTKLAVNYRFVSFSVNYVSPLIEGNDDDPLKGSTTSGGFGVEFNLSKWIIAARYDRTIGYYLKNTEDFIPGWKEGTDPYLQFPELHYKEFGGALAYKFDPRFSFRALSVQTERQLRSAGSFVPGLLYRYYIVDDRTPLTGTNSSQRSNNLEVILFPGYAHTFVLKHDWYLGLAAYAGYGFIHTDLLTRTPQGDISTVQNNPIFRVEGSGALGYNGRRLFLGAQLRISAEAYDQMGTGTVVQNDLLNWQVFVGYRFNAPKFLDKITDSAERKKAELLRKKAGSPGE